jgi:hypothetical protein
VPQFPHLHSTKNKASSSLPGPKDSAASSVQRDPGPSEASSKLSERPVSMVAQTGTQWHRWGHGGRDGDTVAQARTRWQRRGHGGTDGDTVAETGTRWHRRGHGGKDGDMVAQTGTRWQRRGHGGRDGDMVAQTGTRWHRRGHGGTDDASRLTVSMADTDGELLSPSCTGKLRHKLPPQLRGGRAPRVSRSAGFFVQSHRCPGGWEVTGDTGISGNLAPT